MRRSRWVPTLAVLLAAVGVAALLRFPTKAACRASGRVVDPTERHCVAADGFEQLREHVLFHLTEVVVLAAALAALVAAARWLRRRRGALRSPSC